VRPIAPSVRAFGGILDRHHGKVGASGFHRLEAGVDVGFGERLGLVSELLVHRLLGERARRTEIGDARGLFQRTAGRDDFTDQTLDRIARQRAGIGLPQATHDLRFAFGTIDLFAVLGTSDLLGDARPLRHQLQDGVVDTVDSRPQRLQRVVHHAGR